MTESCHGLGRHVTECQNEEDIEDCTTRQYIDSYIRQCGCIPISIFRASKYVYPLNCNSIIESFRIMVFYRPMFVLLRNSVVFKILQWILQCV